MPYEVQGFGDENYQRSGPRAINAKAPLADTSLNVGAPMSPLSWANTFKNSQTGRTSSVWAANILRNQDQTGWSEAKKMEVAALTGASAPQSITQSVLKEILPTLGRNPFAAASLKFNLDGTATPARTQTPSLTTLAGGGANHATAWWGNDDPTKFNWGSAFN